MHPNEDLARRELDAIRAGADIEALGEFYADDFVLHYPGRNPLAGDYRSLEDFLAKFEPVFGEDATVTRELHDALGSDDHAVQLLEVTANAGGRSYSWRGLVVMHTRDGRISEAWIHNGDQYGLDEFLNSLAGS
jgi:hypothetical protein